MVITKKEFNKYTHSRQEDLLTYYHRLYQALHKADLPGRLLLKKETRRVKEKILFAEALA